MDQENFERRADLGLPRCSVVVPPLATRPQRLKNWTDDRVADLRRYHAEGLSASQIANQLGEVSRNAVIGKVHRLGLIGKRDVKAARIEAASRRKSRLAKNALRKRAEQVKRAKGWFEGLPQSPLPDEPHYAGSLNLSYGDLTSTSCRWIEGDPRGEHSYCGQEKLQHSSYCEHHSHTAHRPVRIRERPPHKPVPMLLYRIGITECL